MAAIPHESRHSEPEGRRELATRLRDLLPGASADTIDRLADSARIRALRPGDVIYPQGEVVPLTLILDGYGVARRTTTDGHEIMSGVAHAGVVFGYSGIAGEQSSVEITALTEGRVAQWPGTQIRALMAVDAGFALDAIDSMAASLHQTVERIEGFLHQDARRRVLRILARHSDLFFGDPAILDRNHLTGLVGTTREMTRRVLRRLEDEGTVQRVGATGLRLLRPDQLEES
jgi:CRP-like cAMP-binding protein